MFMLRVTGQIPGLFHHLDLRSHTCQLWGEVVPDVDGGELKMYKVR